jgi:hypothetical protein
MGKRLLYLTSSFLLLASISPSSIINAASDQIHITATVLPSPQWLSLVQQHSTITETNNTYIVHLTDGNIHLNHQKIILSGFNTQSFAFTNSQGIATFTIPQNNYHCKFIYSVMGEEVILNYNNLYKYLSYRFIYI